MKIGPFSAAPPRAGSLPEAKLLQTIDAFREAHTWRRRFFGDHQEIIRGSTQGIWLMYSYPIYPSTVSKIKVE
jgi:hypothetical protein